MFVVTPRPRDAKTLEIVARLLGFSPRRFLTAEGALRGLSQEAPDVLLTDSALPGGDGLSLIRDLKTKSPETAGVLMTRERPGLPSSAVARYRIDGVVVRRGPWTTELRRHVLNGTALPTQSESILDAIDQGEGGFELLVERLTSGTLPPEIEILTLEYLAVAFDPDRVLSVLERIILEDSGIAQRALESGASPVAHPELHRVALTLAMRLKGAGFHIVEEIAGSAAAPADLRARAMRHLSENFGHDAATPTFEANLRDPSAFIRDAAAAASFRSAVRAGDTGFDTLKNLVAADAISEDIRIRALRHLCRESNPERARFFWTSHWRVPVQG